MLDIRQPFEPTPDSAAANGDGGRPAPPGTGGTVAPEANYFHQYSRGDIDHETTRYLSAATQVYINYARAVVRTVIEEPHRALPPSYGADPGVVACWALTSLRRRTKRDALLTAILALGVFSCWLAGAVLPWINWIPVVVAAILVAAWAAVSMESFQIRKVVLSHMLRGDFRPDDAPDPRTARIRQRLHEVQQRPHGNLVIFSGQSAFAGSGLRLNREHIVIDISRRRKGSKDGQRREPVPFTSADLHADLIGAISNSGLAFTHVEERLFINGTHIQDNPGLLPGWAPPSPPPSSVDDDVLRRAALYPTPDARVYVCAQMPGWQGQLVMTSFVRAVCSGKSLYVEWSFYVLPPLKKAFLGIDQLYRESLPMQIAEAGLWGLRTMIPEFIKSPFAIARDAWHPLSLTVRQARQGRKIRHGQVFDYGAQPSIRENASGSNLQHYFLARDEIMGVLIVQQTLVRTILTFLRRHNIDTSQFKSQARVINKATYNRYNTHVKNVHGTGIAIGVKSKIAVEGKSSDSAKKDSGKED